jgi:hypothetical protein
MLVGMQGGSKGGEGGNVLVNNEHRIIPHGPRSRILVAKVWT